MKSRLPLIAIGTSIILFALARCGTTAPLPELLSDGGTDGGSALRVDTSQLENGIPTVPYLERLQASGGVRPLRWSLDQRTGDFGWVQLDEAGNLYGTPSRITAGNLTVTVHDALDAGAQATLPLSVVGCQEGAQYPCEVANVGACELGVSTCNAGQLGACGALAPSGSAFGCGAGCGACDTTLADRCLDGGTCACGTLAGQCAPGGACCPGANCVDLANDPAHCKSCENDCNVGKPAHTSPLCGALACDYHACEAGYLDCDQDPGNTTDGCEVNPQTDPHHCGGCSNDCTAAANVADAGCTTGLCHITQCRSGWGDCDAKADSGCETNLTNSATNCGACGTVCAQLRNVQPTISCSNSTCQVHSSCSSGYADCNNNPSDGCEQPVNSDPNHCGPSCTVCPRPDAGGYAVCNNGVCGVVCDADAGYSSCGGNTSCYDILDDRTHCGTSCMVCSGSGSCFDGVCCVPGSPGC